MRIGTSLLMSALVLSLMTGCARNAGGDDPAAAATREARAFERHVRDLSERASEAESVEAWRALSAAGTAAFPTLVAHFDHAEVAAEGLRGATGTPTTVGEACFNLLQMQVEGRWPKSLREYHVLSRENAEAWLAERRGMTLAELRLAAAREALEKAEAAMRAEPPGGWAREA